MDINYKQKYKISVTTPLGLNSIYYIISLIQYGIKIHSIIVQTNRYRSKREKKKLDELGLRYLLTYIYNYLIYKILKLPTSPKGYIYAAVFNTTFGKKLINKIKNTKNIKPLDQFKEIKQYELDYFSSLKIIKRVVKEANAPTQIIKTQKINSSDTEAFLKTNKIDILVISGGTIIRSNILNSISKCAITIHNSFLPYLRGWGGGEVWALIHDQKEALGTTIFYTEKGVDSGDILNQENLKIDADDTIDTLRYKNIILGKKLIIQAIELLLSDNAPRMVQNNKYVTHINRRPNKNEKIIAIDNLEKWKFEIHK